VQIKYDFDLRIIYLIQNFKILILLYLLHSIIKKPEQLMKLLLLYPVVEKY